jgi:hypothetical protein
MNVDNTVYVILNFIADIYFIDLNLEQIIFSVPINDIDTKNITNGALMYDDV